MLLPVSQNFTKIIPTATLAVLYLSSFYLLTFVVDKLPIAIVYATWSGLGSIYNCNIRIYFLQTITIMAGCFRVILYCYWCCSGK